jgi:1,4-alpha-glucan branching enzyme
MTKNTPARVGYLSLTLHAHLPFVLHHGTWPHGLEWLLEAATETYLPLLRTLARLNADKVPFCLNISLSPVLLDQLAHPDFKAELPQYLQRKIVSSREDAAFFEQAGERHLLSVARHWENVFTETLRYLETLNGDLVAGFRHAEANNCIQIITSAATHGYVPLLGTDESIRAQFLTAVQVHQHHFGKPPAGAWLPECGYRPAGPWRFPVPFEGSDDETAVERIGTETALSDAGLRFTFVDTHLVQDAEATAQTIRPEGIHSFYRPYLVSGSDVAIFARDPRTAVQVWSAQFGYPGDFDYLDFHKKRWPGGHRYWRVTGAGLGMTEKQVYYPESAVKRTRAHAEHFVQLVADTLATQPAVDGHPPVLSAPFDLELFGHWWHEGLQFLEAIARVLATGTHGVQAITASNYLARFGTAGSIHMSEGSWGAGGDNSVWLNSETTSAYSRIYSAELAVRSAARNPAWTDGATGERIARQMCRELMLLESSDWPTLITTGAARDYAEHRIKEHTAGFESMQKCWQAFLETGTLNESCEKALTALEQRDSLFHDLDPAAWITSSKS